MPYTSIIPAESIWKHLGKSIIWKLRKRVKQGKWQNEDKASAQMGGFLNVELYKLLFLHLTLLLQLCSPSLFLFVPAGFSGCKGQY